MSTRVNHWEVAGKEWAIAKNGDGTTPVEHAQLAVLQDIYIELKKLNGLLHCSNFVAIPSVLREIRKNTAKRRRRKIKP